ncbi:hypothetical protein AA313_de0205917 [Arthrobotrys entomopaga]|nr:hypothetical protein AA313_de0205917 [Arthrobotrys entomopaga]
MLEKVDLTAEIPSRTSSPLAQGGPKYLPPHLRDQTGKKPEPTRPTTPPPKDIIPKQTSPYKNGHMVQKGRAIADTNWRDRSKPHEVPTPPPAAQPSVAQNSFRPSFFPIFQSSVPNRTGSPTKKNMTENTTRDDLTSNNEPGSVVESEITESTIDIEKTTSILKDLDISETTKEGTSKQEMGKDETDKDETDKEESSKEASIKEAAIKEESSKEESSKEEVCEKEKNQEQANDTTVAVISKSGDVESPEVILPPNIVYVFDFGFNGLFSTQISETDEKRYDQPPNDYFQVYVDPRIRTAVEKRVEATRLFWGSDSKNLTQKEWTDLAVGWHAVLQDLNDEIYADISRCMQDPDVSDLLQLLSTLTKQYTFYSSHEISHDIAGPVLTCIGKLLNIFVRYDTDTERREPFLYERWKIFQQQKTTWVTKFHGNFAEASEEFRGLINASENTQLRNHYLPESGKWVNICECLHGNGDGDPRVSHKLLSPFVITMNGDIRLVEDDSEFEYIWGGEHYYLKTPPITPPRRSFALTDGFKLGESFFDDDGNFCIRPSLFNVVNAKAAAPKKRTNDEGVLILDFDFIKAMEQYAREFADYTEKLIRAMELQNIGFNERYISAIANIFNQELKARLRIDPNDTFFGMESLDSHVIFEAFWGPSYTLYTTTRQRMTIRSHQPRLTSNLTQHLKVVYNDLHERGKITVETGRLGKDNGGTLLQSHSAALSTTAFSGFEGTRRHPDPEDDYSIARAPDDDPSDENVLNEASTFVDGIINSHMLALHSKDKEDLQGSDDEGYEKGHEVDEEEVSA